MNFLERYRLDHTHPVNKALHTVGIPAIVVAVIGAIADAIFWPMTCVWWWVGLFVGGWILQFVGHAFEGKPPSFFSNPLFLLVGPWWWLLKILGIKDKNDP